MNELANYLGLKYGIVGIKINPKEEGEVLNEPSWFCQLVKEASMYGKEFFINSNSLACSNAEITLGFRKPQYIEIEPRIKDDVKAIKIGGEDNADILLLTVTPNQAMNLSVLLGGIKVCCKGEMGVCGEAVASCYVEKKPSLSLLCNGARIMGKFRENEMCIAILKNDFDLLVDNVKKLTKTGGALCGCSVSDIPKEMVRAFKDAGFEKAADYFFGNVLEYSIRLYLNKDETGRIKYLTLYIPSHKKHLKVNPPFQLKIRGDWTDGFAIFEPKTLGLSLYESKNIKETIERLVKEAFK